MVGELQKALGRNLRRARLQRQLSQEAFADVLGVHRTYVGILERGERNASLQTIEWLADQLNIQPLELLQDDDEVVRPLLRAAADGEVESVPDARDLPPVRRPRPRA